jgi:hypothetical protein
VAGFAGTILVEVASTGMGGTDTLLLVDVVLVGVITLAGLRSCAGLLQLCDVGRARQTLLSLRSATGRT